MAGIATPSTKHRAAQLRLWGAAPEGACPPSGKSASWYHTMLLQLEAQIKMDEENRALQQTSVAVEAEELFNVSQTQGEANGSPTSEKGPVVGPGGATSDVTMAVGPDGATAKDPADEGHGASEAEVPWGL